MELNLALRIIYVLLWLFYLLSRLIPSRGLPSLETSRADRRAALKEEGWYIFFTIAMSWYGTLIVAALYLLDPPWMLWSYLYLPEVLRILGVIIAALLIPYTYWVGKTLADNYSDTLQIQEKQTLITTGPYGRVRHPIYASAIYFLGALVIVSDNFLFLILLILIIPGIFRRIKKEEEMMMDQFGEEYLDYMKRTGRIFPKV
ncbi:MAG: methyltransferase family protein [Candidatus Thorarchaeota archaeon]|jgi:protein-S-isoprenylcysteine O-methyltransferase Ste14